MKEDTKLVILGIVMYASWYILCAGLLELLTYQFAHPHNIWGINAFIFMNIIYAFILVSFLLFACIEYWRDRREWEYEAWEWEQTHGEKFEDTALKAINNLFFD